MPRASVNGNGKGTDIVSRDDAGLLDSGMVRIEAPDFRTMRVRIVGVSPFVQIRFSEKAKAIMRDKMESGPQARARKPREARDFNDDYAQAMYLGLDGERGMPAASFRIAMINACRTTEMKMTVAKMALFVLADTFDATDGTALVHIEGTPEKVEHTVRNATGVADIRVRAMWREWFCNLRIRWDNGILNETSVLNLLSRAGQQIGVGEGRHFSKSSAGMGWGMFEIDLSSGATIEPH